jgi:hypothetical protein
MNTALSFPNQPLPFDDIVLPDDINLLIDYTAMEFNAKPYLNLYRVKVCAVGLTQNASPHKQLGCALVAAESPVEITPSHSAFKDLVPRGFKVEVEVLSLVHGAHEYVVYSENEWRLNHGRGFWSMKHGWTALAEADVLNLADCEARWLPMSLGNDRLYRLRSAMFYQSH